MLKTCSLFMTCHYQIYIPMPMELNPRGMFQDCLRSKAWFLHHNCRRNNSEEGLWNVTAFFFWTPSKCMDIWTQNDIFQHLNSSNLFWLKRQLIQVPNLWDPEERDHVIQSDRFPWGFPPPTSPLSIFAPFFDCSQSSVSLDCIWNYRSSYHSLKRLVCPALCILAVLSNP